MQLFDSNIPRMFEKRLGFRGAQSKSGFGHRSIKSMEELDHGVEPVYTDPDNTEGQGRPLATALVDPPEGHKILKPKAPGSALLPLL